MFFKENGILQNLKRKRILSLLLATLSTSPEVAEAQTKKAQIEIIKVRTTEVKVNTPNFHKKIFDDVIKLTEIATNSKIDAFDILHHTRKHKDFTDIHPIAFLNIRVILNIPFRNEKEIETSLRSLKKQIESFSEDRLDKMSQVFKILQNKEDFKKNKTWQELANYAFSITDNLNYENVEINETNIEKEITAILEIVEKNKNTSLLGTQPDDSLFLLSNNQQENNVDIFKNQNLLEKLSTFPNFKNFSLERNTTQTPEQKILNTQIEIQTSLDKTTGQHTFIFNGHGEQANSKKPYPSLSLENHTSNLEIKDLAKIYFDSAVYHNLKNTGQGKRIVIFANCFGEIGKLFLNELGKLQAEYLSRKNVNINLDNVIVVTESIENQAGISSENSPTLSRFLDATTEKNKTLGSFYKDRFGKTIYSNPTLLFYNGNAKIRFRQAEILNNKKAVI